MKLDDFIITTQDQPAGYTISDTLGLVRGNTVRSRNIGSNFLSGLKSIVGGEISGFTKLITESREEAIRRLVEHAKERGANAVVGMRFITTEVGQTCSEILAYGTAVKMEKKTSS
jgi:uncharacterized protein YbjQ (UPF0145 family)